MLLLGCTYENLCRFIEETREIENRKRLGNKWIERLMKGYKYYDKNINDMPW